jgi:hypothetical protein
VIEFLGLILEVLVGKVTWFIKSYRWAPSLSLFDFFSFSHVKLSLGWSSLWEKKKKSWSLERWSGLSHAYVLSERGARKPKEGAFVKERQKPHSVNIRGEQGQKFFPLPWEECARGSFFRSSFFCEQGSSALRKRDPSSTAVFQQQASSPAVVSLQVSAAAPWKEISPFCFVVSLVFSHNLQCHLGLRELEKAFLFCVLIEWDLSVLVLLGLSGYSLCCTLYSIILLVDFSWIVSTSRCRLVRPNHLNLGVSWDCVVDICYSVIFLLFGDPGIISFVTTVLWLVLGLASGGSWSLISFFPLFRWLKVDLGCCMV